jgi:ribosomal protein L14E/L6E/L27E
MSESYDKIVLSKKGTKVNKATVYVVQVDGFVLPRDFATVAQAKGYLLGWKSMNVVKDAQILKKTYTY